MTESHDSVPALFKCPVSLEVMADPVSLCTGVTYDRASIQRWLLNGNNVCPATGQVLQSLELIPNHTLRRLIQNWCQANISCAPATHVATTEQESVRKLVKEVEIGRDGRLEGLRRLKNLGKGGTSRRVMKEEGVLCVVVRVMEEFENLEDVQEAVGLMALFDAQDFNATRAPVIRALEAVLARGSLESRMSSAAIVEKVTTIDKYAAREIGSVDGVTEGLLNLFQENISYPLAVKASLKALLPLCSVVRSRAMIAKAGGAVCALIELLPGAERGVTEQVLGILEALSVTWEGRCSIMAHAHAVPTIVRRLLVVSDIATDYVVRILLAICFNCGEAELLREVVEMGAFEKLLVVLQLECGQRTKRYANQLLRILAPLRQENNESCLKSSKADTSDHPNSHLCRQNCW